MALLTAIVSIRVGRGHAPWFRRFLLLAACWGAIPSALGANGEGATREYALKAVFLFNFAQFVEWPEQAFDGPAAPLVIGVLGEDPFRGLLEQTVRGERIGQRGFEVRRCAQIADAQKCHILFISASETRRISEIVSSLAGKNVLTVSDADDAAARGVVIGLVTDRKRIRLKVNMESARQAGLTISSKLLRAADVDEGRGE